MRSSVTWILLPLLLLFSGQLRACRISGSLKPGIDLIDVPIFDSSLRFLSSVPLRLMLSQRLGSTRLDLAYMICPTAGDPAFEGQAEGISTFRIDDLYRRILPSEWKGTEHFSLLQNLDRLSIRLNLPFSNLTLGRQAIYWGVSKSVSPTDFIAPFQYGTIDAEYRVGVDAARATFPIGIMSELDAGWLFGKDALFNKSGGWLRGRFYLLQTDAALLAACFRENLMLGGSLNRVIGEATGWVECAYVQTAAFQYDSRGRDRQSYWTASVGWDRSWFDASLYGFIEYHYNSPGSDDIDDYQYLISTPAYSAGNIYLLGKHYLCPGMSWVPYPLLRVNGSALFSCTDTSLYLSLTGEYDVSQNTSLEAGFHIGSGCGEDGGADEASSEFGSWPGVYYLRAKYYF